LFQSLIVFAAKKGAIVCVGSKDGDIYGVPGMFEAYINARREVMVDIYDAKGPMRTLTGKHLRENIYSTTAGEYIKQEDQHYGRPVFSRGSSDKSFAKQMETYIVAFVEIAKRGPGRGISYIKYGAYR